MLANSLSDVVDSSPVTAVDKENLDKLTKHLTACASWLCLMAVMHVGQQVAKQYTQTASDISSCAKDLTANNYERGLVLAEQYAALRVC